MSPMMTSLMRSAGRKVILTGLSLGLVVYLLVRVSLLYQLPGTPTNDQLRRQVVTPSRDEKRVLVTGAAGFIGFHLSKRLSQEPLNTVIAMDNFNDYYDVRLKIDRAHELHKHGIEFHNGDLCNEMFLRDIFESRRITHVVHLAAQAGVRYSLEHPLAYVRANVECQLILLNVIKDFPSVKLVFASSSSVYGKDSTVPFSLHDNTDRPGNMYAATKKTDEMLSLHYCRHFNMSAVGLRFFTVYGPWGRPDMAVYKFAESILDGKEVPMYFISDDEPLGRDFTYVDDLIRGILSAMDYEPISCGEQFNLGLGSPVSVPNMIQLLEKELKTPASIKKLPLPPTEILRTWADISESKEYLNFQPTTTLKEGIRQFALWFRGYRKRRQDELDGRIPWLGGEWFKSLTEEKNKRNKLHQQQMIRKHNDDLKSRLEHEREKYYRSLHPREKPQERKNFTYTFFNGVDSNGGDISRHKSSVNNIEELKQACTKDVYCVAFNSDGVLKRSLLPKESWNNVSHFSSLQQGLYVADVDICEAGLHQCARNNECVSSDLGTYSCRCSKTFYGSGEVCLPRVGGERTKELDREYRAEEFSLHNIAELKQGKSLVFFQGMDSPGGDYLVADIYRGNHNKLKEICTADPLCLGINTNGLMKRRIESKKKWIKWSAKSENGIFVFDANHCLLRGEECPEHSSCKQVAPADYQCVCDAPRHMSEQRVCEIQATTAKSESIVKVVNTETMINTNSGYVEEKEPDLETYGKEENAEKPKGGGHSPEHSQNKSPDAVDVEILRDIPNSLLIKNIHVLLSVDSAQYQYTVTLMNSIVINTNATVNFHIVVCGIKKEILQTYIDCFNFSNSTIEIIDFQKEFLDETYVKYMSKKNKGGWGYLSSCANYARFFFHRIYPRVERAIYMDIDTVVTGDLAEMWSILAHTDKLLGVVVRSYALQVSIAHGMLNSAVTNVYRSRHNKDLNTKRPAFNAGVYYVNLEQWRNRSHEIADELKFWLEKDTSLSLWNLGTQPLMWMAFHEDIAYLESKWHLDGLGYMEDVRKEQFDKAKILHWNGHNKPWKESSKINYAELWIKYKPVSCGGRQCAISETGLWTCDTQGLKT